MDAIPQTRLRWTPSWRIVSSRYPPVGLFDAVADPADLDAVLFLEGLTNPRLRQQVGELSLVAAEKRISGPGATPIMAAFTHLNPEGSRFSDGSFGVYYAARERQTAIAETVYHQTRFLARTAEPPAKLEMRSYLADIHARLHDIRGGWPELHHPHSYAASQHLATQLRNTGSNGLVYDSVRASGGQCVAIFHPNLIAPVRQSEHYHYHWNGHTITHVTIAGDVVFQA